MRAMFFITSALMIAFLFGSCGTEEALPGEEMAQDQVLTEFTASAGLECTYKCIKCLPPNAPACEFLCVYIGNCESRCPIFEECGPGYAFSEKACRCLPDVP